MRTDKVHELEELRNRLHIFRDRAHAGSILATMLEEYAGADVTVLAIPAGGVPVAVPIVKRLGLRFDLAVVSKITLPWSTESGYGAVAFDGTVLLNERILPGLRLDEREIREGILRTREKVNQRLRKLRGSLAPPDLEGRTAILVDDGLASGITMIATVEAVRKASSSRVIIAVPTAHEESIDHLIDRIEGIYCANIRSGPSFAVASAYERWYDVPESEVVSLLGELSQGKRD